MLHEGIIEKAATAAANLADGIDTEKEFHLVAECSNTETDAHYHNIMPEFLGKMEKTLNKKKTPFLLDHNIEQKIGKSVKGYTEGEDMKMKLFGQFRIPRDWNLKVDTDQFIKGVENETLDAVSIGIRVSKVLCNICEKNAPTSIWDFFFPSDKTCVDHRPGRQYKSKLAKWLVYDGSLGEVSSVYAGANYKAGIVDYTKAFLSQTDFYKDMTEEDLECVMPFIPEFSSMAKAFPMSMSDKEFSFPAHLINPNPPKPPTNGGNDMDFEKELAKLSGQASVFMKDLPDDPVKAMQKVIEECQTLKTEKEETDQKLAAAEAKAKKFDEYYDSRVEKAIEFGIIAEGEDFEKDDWTEILKGYNNLKLVEKQLAKWEAEADEVLPAQDGPQAKVTPPASLKKKNEGGEGEEEETWNDWMDY